jgi:hypothetical protein
MTEELEPIVDSIVPRTLIPPDKLSEKIMITRPAWAPLDGKALRDRQISSSLGIVQKKLSNGIKVNLLSLDTEPQRACLRLYVPGVK